MTIKPDIPKAQEITYTGTNELEGYTHSVTYGGLAGPLTDYVLIPDVITYVAGTPRPLSDFVTVESAHRDPYQAKYEALLAAVYALDPLNQIFNEWDGDCMSCEKPRIAGVTKHTAECPVTHLRELLREGVS